MIFGIYYFVKAFSSLELNRKILRKYGKAERGTPISSITNQLLEEAKEDDSNMRNELIFIGCIAASAMLFAIVGLFSFNWPVFLAILIYSTISAQIQKLIKREPSLSLLFSRINYFVSGSLFLFAGLNSYHFQIDMYELIKNLF